jgi:hypothetical protein
MTELGQYPTTESAFCVNLRMARRLLYGCTTTPEFCVSGNTEYVWMSFFGYRSFSLSSRKLPRPDPVPPAIECNIMKPSHSQYRPYYTASYEFCLTSSESLPSDSRSIMSMTSSCTCSPMEYPAAQLLPAPVPSLCT